MIPLVFELASSGDDAIARTDGADLRSIEAVAALAGFRMYR